MSLPLSYLAWEASASEFIARRVFSQLVEGFFWKLRNYLESTEFPSATQQLPGRLRLPRSPAVLPERGRGGRISLAQGCAAPGWRAQVHTSI